MAKKANSETTVEQRLQALYDLQEIDSKIDKIRIIRGELPLEVQDLEDDVAGLETRTQKAAEGIKALEDDISGKKIQIKESQAAIAKYKEQQGNVRNNREYDSLTKETEFQELEIQLAEKRIKEYQLGIENKIEANSSAVEKLARTKAEFEHKQNELAEIIAETEKEEADLAKQSEKAEKVIEERLLIAYKRIRGSARNGLAVVPVLRNACGGCFNKIPPQRQLDINMHKKVIVCEHCGRVLIDPKMAGIEEVVEEKPKRRTRATKAG
ncbi:MAG: putative nucleic acid-binding Zn-ribbon protein [Vicingaceae bacterium]|jgi:predicted  nucleic acid-binding Zn-ribbon protein